MRASTEKTPQRLLVGLTAALVLLLGIDLYLEWRSAQDDEDLSELYRQLSSPVAGVTAHYYRERIAALTGRNDEVRRFETLVDEGRRRASQKVAAVIRTGLVPMVDLERHLADFALRHKAVDFENGPFDEPKLQELDELAMTMLVTSQSNWTAILEARHRDDIARLRRHGLVAFSVVAVVLAALVAARRQKLTS